ncbi:UDP-N-acetylmuramoyl-tripeptide--D-alanyl-D-alanine ligase [Candidatus Hydrogenedentota bacterium]
MDDYTLSDAIEAVGGRMAGACTTMKIDNVTIDSRKVGPGTLFVALKGPNFDGHDYIGQALKAGAVGVLSCRDENVNEYADQTVISVGDTYEALGQLAGNYRWRFDIPVLAVTGSCGKTTTKDLIAAVIGAKYQVTATEGNFNNHIGLPLTLFRIDSDTEFAVVEMGMNALGEIEALCEIARPTMGLITNVGTAHAGPVGGAGNVVRAKGELLDSMGSEGIALLNADDTATPGYISGFRGKAVTFGRGRDADYRMIAEEWLGPNNASVVVDGIGEFCVTAFGDTGKLNALAAIAVGSFVGLDGEEIQRGLDAYVSSEMRGAILDLRGIKIINDAYNANPVSAASAIDALSKMKVSGKRVAALGDMLELGDAAPVEHEGAGRCCASADLSAVYAIGEYAGDLVRGAVEVGMAPGNCKEFDNHEAMAVALSRFLSPGDALLVKGSRGMKMEEVITKLNALLE